MRGGLYQQYLQKKREEGDEGAKKFYVDLKTAWKKAFMAFSWPFNLHLYDMDSTTDACLNPVKQPYPGGWPDDPAATAAATEKMKQARALEAGRRCAG